MALRMIEGGKGDPPERERAAEAPYAPRTFAPGAPPSPGTLPLELALHLRGGEPLV